jgi:hypothetical protein
VLIAREPQLTLAVGRAHPRALDRDAAAAERHLAGLATVTDRRAIRVVLAPRTDDLVDLLGHQLVQDAEPDADRQREQTLLRGARQLTERLLHRRSAVRRRTTWPRSRVGSGLSDFVQLVRRVPTG